MDSSRWVQITPLFHRAIDLPADQRQEFLLTQCPDETLREELVRLLAFHDEESDFLQSPLVDMARVSKGIDPYIGMKLDGFEIVRPIAAGGMGVVYEARQEHPIRSAAIKFLRPGCLSRKSLWRFQHESETLARLQHPGIAHVYAAGAVDMGVGVQPWFAMELIDGQPLDQFCREHNLGLKSKLDLLLKICDAIQHAHQRGVIHRDLKPANILVCRSSDDAGVQASFVPKIVDFGVARVANQEYSKSMQTAGDVVGTLNYCSPEQLSGNSALVDVGCDVYSMGVISYELLTGRLPIDIEGVSVGEAIQRLTHNEPLPLGNYDRHLRGDLQVIISKALEKEPTRRYLSIHALALDLQNYLNYKPILARPINAFYRARKYLRRNRLAVASLTCVLLSMSAGMALYAIEARKAQLEAEHSQYEADKAIAVNSYITNDFLMNLLHSASTNSGEKRLPLKNLIEQATDKLSGAFISHPEREAAVRNELGTIYYNIGEVDAAIEQYQWALRIWEQSLGTEHPDTLKAVNNLGLGLLVRRRLDEAEPLLRRALDGRQRVLGEAHEQTLATMNNYAETQRALGRMQEAESLMRQVIELQKVHLGVEHKTTLTSIANLGSMLASNNRLDEAAQMHRFVYEACVRTLGEMHVVTLHAASRLGSTLYRTGQLDEALALLKSVRIEFDKTLGTTHVDTVSATRLLARILKAQGQNDAARPLLQSTLDSLLAEPNHDSTVASKLRSELKSLGK